MNLRKPLRGKRFGKLVVTADIYRLGEKTLCQCQCDCGKNVTFRRIDLSRGRHMSCGCATPRRIRGEIIEKGRRFGRLTVVAEVSAMFDGGRYFLCKCDCGEDSIVRRRNLLQGFTKSCGCLQKESIEKARASRTFIKPRTVVIEKGQRFGRLTVRGEVVDQHHNNRRRFLCDCDCGGTNIVSYSDLIRGKCRSCGCLRRELARAMGRRNRQEVSCHPA